MVYKDVNCGYYSRRRPGQYAGTFGEVKEIQRKNGITRCAMYNLERNGSSVKDANADCIRRCGESGDIPVLRLLPPAFPFESYTRVELEELIHMGAVFRIYPKADASPLTGWMFDWMLPLLAGSRTPCLIALEDVDLGDLAGVKRDWPQLPVILTNTTQWMNRQYIRFVQAFEEAYLESSNLIEYYGLESLAGILGTERILFGTNVPDKEPYDKMFQLLWSELAAEQRELIAFGNFQRLIERGEGI